MSAGEINLRLQPRQVEAFQSTATELLYGGAAFGGKSHLLRVAAIAFAHAIQGLQVYLFRREFPDLYKNHLQGPSSLLAMLAPWMDAGYAKFNSGRNRVDIGKSSIHLCHCQHEKDVFGYQGAEIHMLLMDELPQFSNFQYRYLRGRLRMVGVEVPPQYRGVFPRVIASGNPGGVSHNSVKADFIDPKPPFEVWQVPAKEGGLRRQFIPALMADNPIGMAQDPGYADRLEGLGDPALVRAMKDGDWDIVAGGAIDDVWDLKRHTLPAFKIPEAWRIDRSFDWGSSHPYSVGWWAEANGEEVEVSSGVKRAFPAGTLIRIAELYGWNGKPNEGNRKLAVEVAREILQREAEMGLTGRVKPGPADSSIFDAENGTSIADDMGRLGVKWERADKSPGSRKNGLERVRQYLKAALQRPMEAPGLLFFDTCRHAIRTLPTLPRNPNRSDDVDTDAEDHAYDEIRYRVLAGKRLGSAFGPMAAARAAAAPGDSQRGARSENRQP